MWVTEQRTPRPNLTGARPLSHLAWLSPGYWGLVVLFFLAPFSVSGLFETIIPGLPSSILVNMVAMGLLLLHLVRIERVRIERPVKLVIGLLLVPMLISFVLLPVNVLTTEIDYSIYISEEVWSRMINILIYSVVFVGGWTVIAELPEEQRIRLLRAYLAALLVFISVGLWQWSSFYLGIPFPDLGSRTYLHSVPTEVSRFFPGRLTSLANEPSFLAPLMIDAAIVGLAVMGPTRRYLAFVLAPAAWVLVFSFSGGGFFNLIVLGGFGLTLVLVDLVLRGRIHRGLVAVLIIAVCTLVVLNGPIRQVLAPVTSRMEMLFDLRAHSRLFMVVMPFVWFRGDGFVSAFFGHGPGSFSLLGQLHRLPNGEPVHPTSNNLFADVVYEQGAVGLLLVAALFVGLVLPGLRGRRRSRNCLLGAVLTVHLAASCLYRADFMGPRFWVVLLSIFILYRSYGCDRDASRHTHSTEVPDGRAIAGYPTIG